MKDIGHSFLEGIVETVRSRVLERLPFWLQIRCAEDFRRMEEELAEIGREAGDGVTAAVLERVTQDRSFEAAAVGSALASERPMRRSGRRDVEVTLLGGTTTLLRQQQYVKSRRGPQRGPRPASGRRAKKSGGGYYPVLAALGIEWGATPALAGEIARQVAASESFRPALEALKSRGIDLGYKPTLRLVNAFGQRAVRLRDEWVQEVHAGEARRVPLLRGKRVVVGIDGGRLRTREPKRHGPRRKNGHRRFDTPWREPKLFTIYIINERGQIERAFRPVYDVTLDDGDHMFRLLSAYLKALGASEASRLIFSADGASWIWKRVSLLIEELRIPTSRVVEIVDWYHAVEHLSETSKQADHWTERQRNSWFNEVKTQLWKGQIDGVAASVCGLSVASGVDAIADRAGYFTEHRNRMDYQSYRRRRIPIGSGATESTVRRVINLRLKGNSKFWRRENAEAMLLLRSYLKAGRFEDLIAWSSSAGNKWWEGAARHDPLGFEGEAQPEMVVGEVT